jgi:glycosyltransferase involved in cell wall biosynthesis
MRKKIIFVYPKLFTFIRTEQKILSEEFIVISKNQNWTNKFLLPFNLLQQLIFLLINIRKVEVILVSFGGYHSLLPSVLGRLFGKKVAIVVHGTDCVAFPQINYGNLQKPLIRWFIMKSYLFADIILPVSESLVYTENTYYSDKILRLGYSYHFNNINTPYKVIPNGLILSDWEIPYVEKEKNTFVSVMTCDQTERKGADLIINVAKLLTNCTFYIAGTRFIKGVEELPKNVKCLGRLTPSELRDLYSKTQFYLQLSNFEGFGVAICEAMLCYCVPIVSDVNFLPNIVGDTGFILRKREEIMLEKVIKNALNDSLQLLGKKAKNRIETQFPVSKRRDRLANVLKH